MKRDDEKNLHQHLGLFGAPSNSQLDASRARIRERLRAGASLSPAADARPSRALRPTFGWQAWRTGLSMAAAATLIVLISTGRWPGAESLGRVEAADGSLYSLSGGTRQMLQQGDSIDANQVLHSNGGAGAMLALTDGSRIEMRSRSELSLERADDGVRIRLGTGGIIVNAANQPAGHLYVQTRDMNVAVLGTVLVTNAADGGSRVGVIEGEVRVNEGTTEMKLRPGEQVSTNRTLEARPLVEEIAWSREAGAHRAILATFARGMALSAGPLAPLTSAPGLVNAASEQGGTAAAGQTATPGPRFEEASIRSCDPDNIPEPPAGSRGGGANSFQMTPGRTHALCMTLATIIRHAYGYGPADINPGGRGRGLGRLDVVYGLGVEDGRRVRGGPDWVRSERYTIDAVADGAADALTMSGPMLQDLLERRFKVKVHVETEQIPAYALTVAPGGLKMKEGTCTQPDPTSAPRGSGAPTSTRDMVNHNLDAARRGATTSFPCGFAGSTNGPNLLFVGAGAGVPALGGVLGTPVINRTGILETVRFNYALEFAPDERAAGPLGRTLLAANEPSNIPRAPDLFTALEQQLGLKLEPAKAPREFIVIDQVERPSPN